jgi:hypothetical protein
LAAYATVLLGVLKSTGLYRRFDQVICASRAAFFLERLPSSAFTASAMPMSSLPIEM